MKRTALAVVIAAAALLAACHRPPQLPEMGLSTDAIAIEAPAIGEPAPQTIAVVNTGHGALARPSVEAAYLDAEGWLTVTVSGEGAPYAVSVQAITAPLPAGTYRAKLTLACANASASPLEIPVTLTVPPPSYALSTSAVAFEAPAAGDPEPQAFQVANGGRGALPDPEVAVSYTGTAGWLTATMTGTSAPYTVTLSAREVAAMPSGVHTAILTVGSAELGGRRQAVEVRFTLRPQLVISGTLTPFSPAPGDTGALTQTLTVKNVGRGVLPPPAVAVTSGNEWLSGTVTGSADPYTLVVTAKGYRALAAGDHVGALVVSSPGAASSETADVALHVAPPALAVSGNVAWSNYGGCPLPGAETVTVTNAGVGALPTPKVTIPPEAASWLRADVTGTREPYAVRFTVAGAPPAAAGGAAASTVAVLEATGAAPVQVPVSYAALAPAITGTHATPSPLVIHAQAGTGDPAPAILAVRTEGGCIPAPRVSYAYAPSDPDWLSWTVSTAVQRHDVTLRASTAGMAPGAKRELDLLVSSAGYAEHVALTVENATIQPTGALSVGRRRHAAVALPDGRVLVIGGQGQPPGGAYTPLASAEIYDPSRGGFGAYPSLVAPRVDPGSLVLDDGRVVVCGGTSDGADRAIQTCEVSSGGPWSRIATLQGSHKSPSIVQLPSGKLLVAGESNDRYASTPGIEIVDLVTGASTVVVRADSSEPVVGTQAVKLADGRVLVVGDAARASWTYDPIEDRWARSGVMSDDSRCVLRLLQDGRVIAVHEYGSAELWDPLRGTWTATARSRDTYLDDSGYFAASGQIVSLANGRVLALFGHSGTAVPPPTYNRIDVFDPVSETWSPVDGAAGIAVGRTSATVTALPGGQLLIAGGMTADAAHSFTNEAYLW